MSKQSAPPHVAAIAPKLYELTNDVLFGDVRDREQLGFHLSLALENGLSKEELAEAITHLAFYAGWPTALTAVNQLHAIVEHSDDQR